MIRLLPALCLFLFSTIVPAQDVTAFLDYMDRLMVFENGTFKQIESQKPKVVIIGGNAVIYANVQDDLKIFRNGVATVMDRASGIEPIVTDHFVGFTVAGILKVNDGRTKVLCGSVGKYIVEDSLVAYFDGINRVVNVYHKGETIKIEDQLAGDAILEWKAGDNVLAWVSSYDRLFKVFYHGSIYELSDLVTSMDFQCGLDMVAFQDSYDHSFKVFHQGTIYDLEEQMPERYEVGKGVMAWQDVTGSLKVFEGGKVVTAMTFQPQRWRMADSLLVIEDQSSFNVFSKGSMYTLERMVPDSWQASWGTLAYVDVDRTLKYWRDGNSDVVIGAAGIQEYALDRGILRARLNNRTWRVWWKGKAYDY